MVMVAALDVVSEAATSHDVEHGRSKPGARTQECEVISSEDGSAEVAATSDRRLRGA